MTSFSMDLTGLTLDVSEKRVNDSELIWEWEGYERVTERRYGGQSGTPLNLSCQIGLWGSVPCRCAGKHTLPQTLLWLWILTVSSVRFRTERSQTQQKTLRQKLFLHTTRFYMKLERGEQGPMKAEGDLRPPWRAKRLLEGIREQEEVGNIHTMK